MRSQVVYGKCIKYFFAKEGNVFEEEQLVKLCDTLEEAKELAHHLNKVLRGERFPFNSYSVVYGKGSEEFFIINGDETTKDEVLIESFETEEEAESKANNLNEINKVK